MISYSDIESKIKDTKQRIRTELSNFTIPCPVCGQQYHRVAQHAKSAHGIEISTFKETHYYTTATGALANKIFSLYAPKKDRYIQQYIKGTEDTFAAYRTNDKENKWDRYLTQKKMIAHIRGTETYGGLFYPQKSKVLVFDIDSYKPINVDIGLDYYVRTKQMVNKGLKPKANLRMAREFVRIKYKRKEEEIKRSKRTVAFEPTYLILGALYESGIPSSCIHILHSGDKGFHVDLYFDKPVDIKKLVDFGRTIISNAKQWAIADEWEDVEVELRPEGRNSRGVRFPLGIHLSTGEVMEYGKKNHTNFPPVDNQYEYLLSNTKRIEKELFLEQIYPKYSEEKRTKNTSYRTPEDLPASAPTDSSQQGGGSRWVSHNIGDAANNHRKCKHYSREELEKLYEEGLKEPGTRHNVMLGLAILFKQRGFSKAATFKKLLDFSKEKLNGYSKSKEEQIEKDIGQIVRYTYERDYHLAPEEDTKWLLTDSDIRRIANYPYLGLNERITLVFFFILRRMYGKDAYYPIKLLAKWTGFCYRTIQNHIKKFINLGIIEKTYQGQLWNKTSNKYEIKDYTETYITAIELKEEQFSRDTFVKGLLRFCPEELISTTYSPYIRKKWIDPVQIEDLQERMNPKLNETVINERKKESKGVWDNSFFKPIIRVFSWVRNMKRKHGADFAKIYPSFTGATQGFIGKRGYYMRC